MHPIYDNEELLKEILQSYEKIHDDYATKNPELPVELVRQASSGEIKKQYNVDPAHIDTAIEVHDAHQKPEMAHLV